MIYRYRQNEGSDDTYLLQMYMMIFYKLKKHSLLFLFFYIQLAIASTCGSELVASQATPAAIVADSTKLDPKLQLSIRYLNMNDESDGEAVKVSKIRMTIREKTPLPYNWDTRQQVIVSFNGTSKLRMGILSLREIAKLSTNPNVVQITPANENQIKMKKNYDELIFPETE